MLATAAVMIHTFWEHKEWTARAISYMVTKLVGYSLVGGNSAVQWVSC